MSKPVEITLPERTFVCDENSKATVIFTITNIIDENVELAASIDIEDNEITKLQRDWLEIKVDSNWSLDAKATEEVTVNVTIPDDQPLGDYRFKLTVYAKENPGDDFTTSEMICVKKQKIVEKPVEIKKGFPWWMLAVAALLIVVGGGVAWYFTSPTEQPPVIQEVTLPDVKKMKLSDALMKLNRSGLEVNIDKITKQYHKKLAEETVVKQSPDPSTTRKVKKGTKINLTVSTRTLIMKPVIIPAYQIKMLKIEQSKNTIKRIPVK